MAIGTIISEPRPVEVKIGSKARMVVALVMLIAGGLAMRALPIALYPQMTPPTVEVEINYPGANAEVVEQSIPREFLYVADEAFFTGSAAEVTPIRSVDRLPVGKGSRGPITKKIEEDEEERLVTVGFKAMPVFGLEQTDGDPLPTGDPAADAWLAALPLREVATEWGLAIDTYNGRRNGPLGRFCPGRISLGVQNEATWCHELVHAADHRERRQQRLAGRGAGDPRHGARRGHHGPLVERHAS